MLHGHSTKRSVRLIFTTALGLDDPMGRQAFLEEACGQDMELRREVERLLAARLDKGTSPLDVMEVALGPERTAAPATWIGVSDLRQQQIGPYKLLEQIGEGGFGVVYMAEQTTPVRRRVALKIIKPGMDSREVIARFEAERQALAMMDHPNIARILEGGATEHGRPYFVMELVRGIPITQYCDEARLTAGERLELFVTVCWAIQHAHQKGIIHRDLKPSNVMVTMHDDKAAIKVIDFGIAKALRQPLTDRSLFTGYQQLLGTPSYMSPEQAQMNGMDVDTRSDVYSLGVLLYELLTGTTPFLKESLVNVGFDELRRIIQEQEPPRPSARITTLDARARSTIADRRRIDQRKITDQLRGELDWIVMKALEKDRTRRYQSVSEFAQDIRRYLADEPIAACPPSRMYRLGKTLKRNRTALASAALAFAMLAVGMVGTAWQAYQATQARNLVGQSLENEQDARHEADRQRRLAEQNLAKAREAVDRVVTRFADPHLLMLPGLDNVRAELLHEALTFYRGFLEQQSDDPQLRYEAARAWERVAQINEVFNRHTASCEAWHEAIAITEQLLDEFPSVRQYLVLLARLRRELGGYYVWRMFDFANAELQLLRTMEICGELLDSGSSDEQVVNLYWRSHLDLAVVYRETGRLPQSDGLLRQAIHSLQQLLQEGQLDTWGKTILLDCQANLAHQMGDRDPEDTDALFCSAIATAEELFQADPHYGERERLAATCHLRGSFLRRQGRLAEAETDLRRGLELMEPVAQVAFDRFVTRSYCERLRIELARVLLDDGRPDAAREIALKLLDVIPDPRDGWLAVAHEYGSLGQPEWAAEARIRASALPAEPR